MNFPVLQVYSDGSMKVIESPNEFPIDLDWACLNNQPDDFFISLDLKVGRCFCGDPKDKLLVLVDDGARFQEFSADEIDLNTIKSKLFNSLGGVQESIPEAMLATKILSNIIELKS